MADCLPSLLAHALACAGVVYLAALAEYAAHRWLMHAPSPLTRESYACHMLHHHAWFRRFDGEPDPTGRRFNITLDLAHVFAPCALLGLACSAWSAPAAWCAAAAGCYVYFGWNLAHDEMHNPGRHAWLRRLPVFRAWFNSLARRHFLHHEDTSRNYNVTLPLWDALLGTEAEPTVRQKLALKKMGLLGGPSKEAV